MAYNGSIARVGDIESTLEKIKRQLTSNSGRSLLQGPLLKRSETLRKWNERWVILEPTTGKMEYKMRRSEPTVKGTMIFDSNSTITLSPVNFHGLPKYDGCCFYIGTPQKSEYFLCAETPDAAKAWVSTLRATQLVLKAHNEAVNNLSRNGSAQYGTVAAVEAAANSTAMEASKEIEAAMKISMRAALGLVTNKVTEGQLDYLTIMKETLRVKDEELRNLAKDLRARDSTIRDLADELTEAAKGAEAAASAAHVMDKERRLACAEIKRLYKVYKEAEKQAESFQMKLRESEENVMNLNRERALLVKERDSALQEAQMWHSELVKAREHDVLLEEAVLRAEERARVAEADVESGKKDAAEKALVAKKEKEDLISLVKVLQSQIQRQSNMKHVDLSEDNVDKACLNDSRLVPVSSENEVQVGVDEVEIHSITDASARIADVREVPLEAPRSSVDIAVVSPAVEDRHVVVSLTS